MTIRNSVQPSVQPSTLRLAGGAGMWLPSTNLPILRAAVQATRNGTGDARILCIGDSTTAGVGTSTDTTIPATKAYPRILAQLLDAKIASAQGIGNPRRFSGDPDNRWTYGTGWTFGGFSWSSIDAASTPAGTLVYTPDGGTVFDSFDVWYLKNTGLGTITVTASGGTPSVVSTNGAQGIAKVTVAASAAGGSNSVYITGTGACYIIGVEPSLSTRRVRVGNVGVPGATSANWNTATTGFARMAALQTYAPHLTIVSLGLNDATSSVSAATLQTNLTGIVQKAKVSGDVIMWTPPPPSGSPQVVNIAGYQATYAAVAAAESVPLVDIYARWGGTWNATYMDDNLHPNDAGYADIAVAIFAALA